MKKHILTLPVILLLAAAAQSAPVKAISLEKCQQDALSYSNEIKQKAEAVQAALHTYKETKSSFYPSLYIDAKGSWVSEVPKVELGPVNKEFGDNWGYSAGPTLEYMLFDYNGRSSAAKGGAAAHKAAREDFAFAQKSVKLQVRQVYFAVQQDLERMYFMAEQLKVADKQLADITSALKAGSKSNLDLAMAKKQQLKAKVNVSSARSSLGVHLRELFKLTGNDYGIDPSYPADWRITINKEDRPASSLVKADPLQNTLNDFKDLSLLEFDQNSPALIAAQNTADYYLYMAQSMKSALYPALSASAGAYWEYPNNGILREHVFLGRAGAQLRMPLFEGSKTRNKAAAQESKAREASYQKAQLEDELKSLFYSSKSVLYSLEVQTEFIKQMIEQSSKAAELTYDAYKAGSVTFLEVDSANLGLLESRIALADVYIETLNRLAVIDNLGTN